jgi:hypothetical protein
MRKRQDKVRNIFDPRMTDIVLIHKQVQTFNFGEKQPALGKHDFPCYVLHKPLLVEEPQIDCFLRDDFKSAS